MSASVTLPEFEDIEISKYGIIYGKQPPSLWFHASRFVLGKHWI